MKNGCEYKNKKIELVKRHEYDWEENKLLGFLGTLLGSAISVVSMIFLIGLSFTEGVLISDIKIAASAVLIGLGTIALFWLLTVIITFFERETFYGEVRR